MVIDGCEFNILSASGGREVATVKDWVSLHEVGGDSIDEQRVVLDRKFSYYVIVDEQILAEELIFTRNKKPSSFNFSRGKATKDD